MLLFFFFFFNDTATTEIYTLSLHDALPISSRAPGAGRTNCARLRRSAARFCHVRSRAPYRDSRRDRKSTRLNSSYVEISYAVFCLKKKKQNTDDHMRTKPHPNYTMFMLITN